MTLFAQGVCCGEVALAEAVARCVGGERLREVIPLQEHALPWETIAP